MANTRANKVRYGLTNVHIAPIIDVKDGKEVYGDFVRLPGAVNLTTTASGELSKFYADNMAYHTFSSNTGYEGTLEVADIPDWYAEEILGEKRVNGVLVESIQQKPIPFAMAFEFDGDQRATRHVLYNCTASRPDITGQTNTETIEAQTSEMSFTGAPNEAGVVRAKTSKDTPEEVYNAWYDTPFDATSEEEVEETE